MQRGFAQLRARDNVAALIGGRDRNRSVIKRLLAASRCPYHARIHDPDQPGAHRENERMATASDAALLPRYTHDESWELVDSFRPPHSEGNGPS
jgi:hypothetical protein